jgi:LysM repeat protein
MKIIKLFFKIILPCVFLALLTSHAFGEEGDREYVVKKGDTLWDISTSELQDSFLWPKVWKENLEIVNPDLIYPGQKIHIPLYLLQKEIVPVLPSAATPSPVKREEPIETAAEPEEKEYLVNRNILIVSGYIAEAVDAAGRIYDRPGEPSNLSKGDYAYIETKTPVRRGDKYYIINPVEEVIHPVTGKNMGVRITILGTAEVVDEKDPKVLITGSYVEIPVGSLIDSYYEIEPPRAPDNPGKPDVNGYIVTTLRSISMHGRQDIVFLDKGSQAGLVVGDLLATTLPRSDHKIHNGIVQVISTRPATSAAIIRNAAKEVQIGDPVTAVTQE